MVETRYKVLRLSLGRRDKDIRYDWNKFRLSGLKPYQVEQHMVSLSHSEMIAMCQTLNPKNCQSDDSGTYYIKDIVELDVGQSTTVYEKAVILNGGLIYVDDVPYRRFTCSSGDSRSGKVWFCAEDQWDKMMSIMRPGIDSTRTFTASKLNAYDGMVHSASTPVTMPKIVVVDDCETEIADIYDIVEYNIDTAAYQVTGNKDDKTKVSLFDGAGLVCPKMARRWRQDLGKKYLPAAFQFRAIPGLKGVLFTFDFYKFARLRGRSKLPDIWGKEWDLWDDEIDVIMTRSQFKLWKLYDSMKAWQNAFHQECHGYRRTFNISDVSEDPKYLKRETRLAYQHLQTLNMDYEERRELARPTIDRIKKLHSDLDAFLDYRKVEEYHSDGRRNRDWDRIPPYYRAMRYNQELINDPFIKKKVREDLSRIIEGACSGKLTVKGNYQILAPDLYALAQHAFGLPVTGLLKKNQIYSQYWIKKEKAELNLLRNPHIGNEHSLVTVENTAEMQEWYQYQAATIVTGTQDTIALRANSADFDGDRVLTTSNTYLIQAVKHNPANTVVPKVVKDVTPTNLRRQNKIKGTGPVECRTDDLPALMLADQRAMQCNIGAIINPISKLWNLPMTDQIHDYISVLSVVGSLVIDAAKTGFTAKIPQDIAAFLKKIDKPYFMKFLQDANKDAVYSDDKTTMNLICHYIEKNTGNLKLSVGSGSFAWSRLLSGPCNKEGAPYKRVKYTLLALHKAYNYISQDVDGRKNSDWKQRQYDCFFWNCRAELLNAGKDINKTIDIILTLYYTDRDLVSAHDHSILWHGFGEEMIHRAKGDFSAKEIDHEKLKIQHKKSRRKIAERAAKAREAAPKLDNTIVYDTDICTISNCGLDRRERAFALAICVLSRHKDAVTVRKGGKHDLNFRNLSDMSGIDRRQIEKVARSAAEKGATKLLRVENGVYQISYNLPSAPGEIIAKPRTVREVKQLVERALSKTGEN